MPHMSSRSAESVLGPNYFACFLQTHMTLACPAREKHERCCVRATIAMIKTCHNAANRAAFLSFSLSFKRHRRATTVTVTFISFTALPGRQYIMRRLQQRTRRRTRDNDGGACKRNKRTAYLQLQPSWQPTWRVARGTSRSARNSIAISAANETRFVSRPPRVTNALYFCIGEFYDAPRERKGREKSAAILFVSASAYLRDSERAPAGGVKVHTDVDVKPWTLIGTSVRYIGTRPRRDLVLNLGVSMCTDSIVLPATSPTHAPTSYCGHTSACVVIAPALFYGKRRVCEAHDALVMPTSGGNERNRWNM